MSPPSSSSRYPHHPQPPLHTPLIPFPVTASPFNLVPTSKRPRPNLQPPTPLQTPSPFQTPTNPTVPPFNTSPQPRQLTIPPTPLAGAPGHEDHRKTITAAATKKTAKTLELNEGRKPLWAVPSTINTN